MNTYATYSVTLYTEALCYIYDPKVMPDIIFSCTCTYTP